MIQIDTALHAGDLAAHCKQLFALSGGKLRKLRRRWQTRQGSPVFTVAGKYTTRGWTEWTQGFQYGSALLQFDATGDASFLEEGRSDTVRWMAPHLTHTGVHDHGFNNVSTYGNLLRLLHEKRYPAEIWERRFYELALKVSGAVQAARWTDLGGGKGYVYSFNGPHSLFADTIRSMRALVLSWQLGHQCLGEGDRRISLLERVLQHAAATSRYNVWFGADRDIYDLPGRVAHESIFNLKDGAYRCPSTQQGYSPFSTWTRGLAWIVLGFAELLEFFEALPAVDWEGVGGQELWLPMLQETAAAAAEFYISQSPVDGIPYWDTGAPGLAHLGNWQDQPALIRNDHEPVDSSAACIAAQGLIRLGRLRGGESGRRWMQAGLTIARTLLQEPYLSMDPEHEGLILHSIYHRPNGWDHVPDGSRIPYGESSLWGDYHARELALLIQRMANEQPWLKFSLSSHDLPDRHES